ncbi:hypothetical protein [Streptomyces niveus]
MGSEIRLKQLAVRCQIARRNFAVLRMAIHIAAAAVAGLALVLLVAVFE